MPTLFESMKTSGLAAGFIVGSKAGHDKGRVYLVLSVEDKYVFLADGRYRKADYPKKKRIKHVVLLQAGQNVEKTVQDLTDAPGTEAKNIIIRKVIKDFLGSIEMKKEGFDA